MNFSDFRIGMLISSETYPNQIGTVIKVDPIHNAITFNWKIEAGWRARCTNYNTFTNMYICLEAPILTQEDRVSLKIKLLWNQSNWVKKNPQRAY